MEIIRNASASSAQVGWSNGRLAAARIQSPPHRIPLRFIWFPAELANLTAS
jgi:hypothetical protein